MLHWDDGIYNDMSNDEYHGSDAISRSNLMDFKKTPYHYWYNKLSGLAIKKEATPAMIMGELIHTLTLEPNEADNRFIIAPECDRRTKQGKFIYDSFMAQSASRRVIKCDDYLIAKKVSESAKKEEMSNWLISDSKIENSIFFTHKETGLQCKARPDIWKNNIIGDLKTTADASYRAFQRSAMDYGYFLQAGMMHEALKSLDIDMVKFIIIAVEKTEPYMSGIYILDESEIQYGVTIFNKLMIDVSQCIENDKWPDYGVKYLEVPKWATDELEKE